MVQNASAQFLELAAKMSQVVSKNAGAKAVQNASFKTYMEQTGKSKQDVQQPKQDTGNKSTQRANKQDGQATDNVNKDNANVKTDDTVKTEETKETGKQKEVMIDLAALAQMLNTTVVVEVKPENAQTQTAQLLLDAQGNQQTAQDTQEMVQTAIVTTTEDTTNMVNQTMLAQQGNAHAAAQQTQASSQQTTANATTTQIAQQQTAQTTATTAEQAKGTEQVKTETQNNAGQSQNTEVKDNTAKPVEVKVEVNTSSQTDSKASNQTALEDGADAAMFQAPKAEQTEMPVITVQVGDGGQINGQKMAEDVANAIIKKLPSAPNQFEIQLNPKGLGKITIQILFENNQTLVSLSATNAKAASVLSECAKQIGTLIQQHTGNETVVTVQDDKGLSDQQKQQGNRDNAEQQQKENAEKQKRQQLETQDFVQQMRLGLFDGEYAESRSRFY